MKTCNFNREKTKCLGNNQEADLVTAVDVSPASFDKVLKLKASNLLSVFEGMPSVEIYVRV